MSLFSHQQKLIDLNPHYHLLAWECGTGKTAVAIRLTEKNCGGKALVVCPKSLKENWEREIKKWGTKEIDWKIVSKEEFRKTWQQLILEKRGGLVPDEAHFFGGHKSTLYKSMVKYLKAVKPSCVYPMTATPYMSTPFNIMCLESLVGRVANYMKYRYSFFDDIRYGNKIIPKPRKDAKFALAEIVNEIGSTVKKEDCLDLPDQVYLQEDFTLNAEQKRVIKELKDNPLVSNHIVFWTKRHQVSGGTMKQPESDEILQFKSDKLTRLLELIEEHPKLIIVARYNAELEMIAKQLTKPYVIFNGGTIDRQKTIDQANKSDEMVFLVNSACSEGYNLTSFSTMVFYSNGFSFKDRIQMEGRIHRIGQNQKCTYIDLVMQDNVDNDVLKALKNKQDFAIEIYAPSNNPRT